MGKKISNVSVTVKDIVRLHGMEICGEKSADKSRRFEQYTALLEQYGKKNPWLYFDKEENCFKSGTGEGGDMAGLEGQI